LLLVVGTGATVGFALAVAITTVLLVSAAGADKRLLETHLSKFWLRAAFKSWLYLLNAWWTLKAEALFDGVVTAAVP
jgi:hypothetical protein